MGLKVSEYEKQQRISRLIKLMHYWAKFANNYYYVY